MTFLEARTLVSGDQVEWIDGANGCSGAIGTVGIDYKIGYTHFVAWPDGQVTFLNDSPALKCMRIVKKAATVNGFPR